MFTSIFPTLQAHHANYYRIDSRPVLFVYLTRVLDRDGILDEVTTEMRRAALDNGGYDLYIIGDQVHFSCELSGSSKDYKPFYSLDAVTSYGVFGDMGRPNGYARRGQLIE